MGMDRRSYEEKRNFFRVPVECEIALESARNGACFNAVGKDLSAGGVLFHTEQLLEPGERLELHIEASQTLLSVLDATIEVVRVQPLADGLHYAVGGAIRSVNS